MTMIDSRSDERTRVPVIAAGGASALVTPTRVHSDVYTSDAVFVREMERLFAQGWVYVAHDSEVPNAGDYVTRTMGSTPVIVSRGKDGSIRVLANRCTHRGNMLCTSAKGSTTQHRCPYHGWAFGADGQLLAISMKDGYHDRFDSIRRELALAACPRVDSYGGFVFASFAAEGVTLREHLGLATTVIDRLCNLSPTGRIRLGAGYMKHRMDCNWKMVMENNVDGYHALFTHASVYSAVREAKVSHQPHKVAVVVRDLGDGHCEIDYTDEYLRLDEEFVWFGRLRREQAPEYVSAMEAGYGPDKAHRSLVIGPPHALIFPNLFLAEMNIMVLEPLAADACVAHTTPVLLDGASEINRRTLRRCEGAMGPAGFLLADDGEMGARNQRGLSARAPEWLELSRGVEDDIVDAGGTKNLDKTAETPQRGFWRQWAKEMA